MPLIDRLRPYPISVFAGVTLLIWGNRVWLAWTDPTLDFAGKLGYSVPITAFVVAALATLGLQLTGCHASGRRFRSLVAAFAGGTVVYWVIRLPVILLRHHSIPFKLVHSVLAVVLVGLAVGAGDRCLGQRPRSAGERPRRESR